MGTSQLLTNHPMNVERSQPDQAVTPAKVLRRFRVVFNAVRTHFRQMEKQVGLGGAQVWALSLIKAAPGLGVGEIATRMDIHQSTASNLVKSLMSKDFVTMDKAPDDRRNVQLRITPAGTRLLKKASGPFEGVLPAALSSMNPQTLERMDQDLGELIELLQADETAERKPLAQL